MIRASLLAFLVILAHTPLMAGAGVYDLPGYPFACDKTELASLK